MPVITLTTDFGDSDHFVGVMKGVILSIAPRCTIVDITHQVSPYEIVEGAFTISEAWRYFPKKTIHVAVVDPGVGTARRPILVEAAGHCFLGPDNGVLSMIYGREKCKVRHIHNQRFWLPERSNTFHGRDIFAPVAAHLAKGVKPAQIGPVIGDYLRVDLAKLERTAKHCWTGAVLKVDRFGNLITSFHVRDLPEIASRPVAVLAGVRSIERRVGNFAQGEFGEPVLIVGSSGYLEVAVNQGSAAKLLGCGAGAPMELTIF